MMNKLFKLNNTYFLHRGYFDNIKIPENSLEAFILAKKLKYNIELDVRLTKDKKIIVFHDHNLKRMCGVNKIVEDCTYNELMNYYLLNTNYKIPLLEEVLECIKGKCILLVEIKVNKYNGILERELSKILDNYNGEFAIQSFNYLSINWFKRNKKNYIIGILSSDFKNGKINKLYKFISKRLLFDIILNVDFISYDIRALPNKYVLRKRKKKPIFGWTFRTELDLKEKKQYCDYFIVEKNILKYK